ncbi:MAG: Asp-tRNA(Asn)/Glu-tRNA(Gln) amidotransferase subunit GatA [Candidatus Saccharimonadales bacterium]
MPEWDSISNLAQAVSNGKLKALDLVNKSLLAIEESSDFDAIISIAGDRAKQRAKDMDDRISKGEKVGRLAGVPFIAKDNFLTFGGETTAASNILKGFNAPYQATSVNLLEAEGAIMVAKANLDAFAHGASTENSDFMTTKNPHDKTRVPGGSSGGSAAAVMLGMAPFALGTDTGGSIRQPASFTGTVGLKPTYGLVSRSGVIAMSSSTDVIGPLTRNVADAALLLDILAGKDELDSTTIDSDPLGYSDVSNFVIKGAKVGVVKEYMDSGVDAGVKACVESAISKLKSAGAEVVDVSLPSLPLALACYYIICPAEVSSNLSRYDGQRYGFSSSDGKTLEDSYKYSRSQGFGREAKRRIMIGTYVLSSGYYDAYYIKAQQLRTKLIGEFTEAFKSVDFLVGPVAPSIAFKIGDLSKDPLKMYLQDIMTVAANLVGIPAISIPAGTSESMPVGLQIMAPQRADRTLLEFASKTEGIIV